MFTFTQGDIIKNERSVITALQTIGNHKKFPYILREDIKDLLKQLDQVILRVRQSLYDLNQKYPVRLENGQVQKTLRNGITVSLHENDEQYWEELEAIKSKEIEVNASKIPSVALKHLDFSPIELDAISFLIEYTRQNEKA